MKKFGVLVLMFAYVFLLVACSSKTDQVVIWIPGDENEYGFYFDAVENYKQYVEANGGTFDYVIEQQPWGDYWTKLPLEVNNGRGPDLFLTHVAYADVLTPISAELDFTTEQLAQFDYTDLFLGPNNKPLFIPTTFVSKIMYVNTDLHTDYVTGTEYASWDEMLALGKTLATGKPGVIGTTLSFHSMYDLIYDNNGYLTTSSGALETTYLPDALDSLIAWQTAGYIDYANFDNPDASVNDGTSVFIYGEPWMEFWANDDAKARIKAFPVPGNTTYSAELSFGINKNAVEDEELFTVLNDFIYFMLTDTETITDIVKGQSGYPNTKALQETISYLPGTAGDAVLKTLESGKGKLVIPPQSLEVIYNTALEDVLLNGKTSAQAVAAIESDSVNLTLLTALEDKFRD